MGGRMSTTCLVSSNMSYTAPAAKHQSPRMNLRYHRPTYVALSQATYSGSKAGLSSRLNFQDRSCTSPARSRYFLRSQCAGEPGLVVTNIFEPGTDRPAG